MNIVLWVLQVALAFLYVSGGAYKVMKVDDLMKQGSGFPRAGWRIVGVFEVVGGVLLVLPAGVTGVSMLTALAAAALTLETLFLAGMYGRRSVKLVAANPFVWAAAMALMAAFVAYGRYGA